MGAAQGGRHQGPPESEGPQAKVASLGEEWWVNKVGTYGMASAQSYWGRLAALLLRVLYALFPQVDWNFVFVEFIVALKRGGSERGGGIAGHSPGIGHPTQLEEDALGGG